MVGWFFMGPKGRVGNFVTGIGAPLRQRREFIEGIYIFRLITAFRVAEGWEIRYLNKSFKKASLDSLFELAY